MQSYAVICIVDVGQLYSLTLKTGKKTAMARTQDWKLIVNESRSAELYNMAGGRTELENVAGESEFADVRTSLEREIESIWKW